MPTYISSNANRFYSAIETTYGHAAAVTAANRFPAVRLQAQQLLEHGKRLDKTGTRTFLGTSTNARRHTAFEARTYLTSSNLPSSPGYGPLFQCALGAAPEVNSGIVVESIQNSIQIQTAMPHGLSIGSAVSYSNEIRFVTAAPTTSTLTINAPFSNSVAINATLAATITYRLSTLLPSLTLYDYWDPVSSVSRILTGAAVDQFSFSVNGDYHEFVFSGPAADVLNSSSFVYGSAGLNSFPMEPALSAFDYAVVPGHLGQVWLGSSPNQFFTLTEASVDVKNNIELRAYEFGSSYPQAMVPGLRQVISKFMLFGQDDDQTKALYAAAKQRTLISAMLQLGQQNGQLMGIFLPAVTPEIPNHNDSQSRLQWEFKNNVAQGTADDEIFVAFA